MQDLFDLLRELALPPADYAVFGSGPLAIRNIISAPNDLDVICRGAAWEKVLAIGAWDYDEQYGDSLIILHGGKLSFGTRWAIGDFDTDELIDNSELIDELPFVQLENVVKYKLVRASPRDLQHLEALEESEFSICAMPGASQ